MPSTATFKPKTPTPLWEEMKAQAESWIRVYQPKLDKFAEKFKTEPSHALEWSTNVFVAAARVDVARWFIAELTPENAQRLIEAMAREVQSKARWPEKSTSVPSNEMSLQMNAARADFIAEFVK